MIVTTNKIVNEMVEVAFSTPTKPVITKDRYKELILGAMNCEPKERNPEIENLLDGVQLLKACVETFTDMTPKRKLSYIATAVSIIDGYATRKTL